MRYLSFFEYQKYSRIFKERERYISKTENRQTTHKPTDEDIKITFNTYEGQLSTDEDGRKLGHK